MALIVNGERIEDVTIQAEVTRLEQARRQQGAVAGSLTAAEDIARDRLIGQTLLRQEALKSVTISAADVDAEFDNLVKSCGGIEGFRQRYRVAERDDERFKKHLAEGIRMDRLVEQSGITMTVDDHELSQYYAAHFDDFMAPEEIRVSHIVRNPQQGDPEETYAKMCQARRKLLDGADFATVAAEYSECASEPGGDLGFFAKGQMVEGFEAVVFSMDIGEISPVFLTQFGFHVATVMEKRPPRRRAFDEVRSGIAQIIREDRRDQATQALVNRLRAAADIRDIVDSAGGAKTKPAKKRKKK
ncbi:MAG: peptidylprolyl isomerase [Lentisphaeria bacterium]|nr:peptidylprolyl isomerase [Lentisphaeria bacterium]